MNKATHAFAASLLALALLVLACGGENANGQSPLADSIRAQNAAAASAAAGAADDAARHNLKVMKRQVDAQRKQFEKTIMPLSSADLPAWTKVKDRYGQYWQYEIKRSNGATKAIACYSPKIGYVVNSNFQKNGFGWPTLDDALEKQFGKDGLWSLPDIPGWSKAHLLTGDEHIADMKRQALAKAKSKAVDKIADTVADGIVKKVGPKINNQIENELGIDMPVANKAGKGLLQFNRLDDDKDKVRYGSDAHDFMIYKYKDGSGFEVLRDGGDKGWHKYVEVFVSIEEAVKFASNKAALAAPGADERPKPSPE